jgi:hypothetical protein
MSTVAQTRTRSKPADLCRMVVTIRGTDYTVKPLVVEDDDIRAAWTLRNTANGQVYTLANGAYGVTCTCADFEFRHAGLNDVGCKHVKSFRALGLLS